MAEAILRAKNIPSIQVQSAGVHAIDGMPISEHAKTLIEYEKMPYTKKSKALTKELVEWSTLILTMTEAHKNRVVSHFPEAYGKIHTLKQFVSNNNDQQDVHDPFGSDLETYRETFHELSILIDQLQKKINGG